VNGKMTVQAQALRHLCDEFGIDMLYIFGSRAREVREWLEGTRPALAASASDVDVGVCLRRGVTHAVDQRVRMASRLEDLFQAKRVDLVYLFEADPFLAANIIRGERVYAREAYRADVYDLYVLRRAGDLAPLERERMALILEKNL